MASVIAITLFQLNQKLWNVIPPSFLLLNQNEVCSLGSFQAEFHAL